MATSYDYSVSLDFPGGVVCVPNLQTEIARSPIKTALDSILRDGDAISITFKDTLSSTDKTRLDGDQTHPAGGLIADHDATPHPGASRVQIQDVDETTVNWPQTYGVGTESVEGTPRMTPDLFPPGYRLWSTGAFDDLDNDVRGGGAEFRIEESEPDTYEIEGQFLEHVLLVGGLIHFLSGKKDDDFTFHCYAPASTPASAAGNGNADKVGLLRLSGITGTFQAGEVVTGGTSGHTGYVLAVTAAGVQVANPSGAFQVDETVTGGTSGATGTAVRDPDFRGQTGTEALLCIFIPNGTSTGYYNVDGAALTVGEINTNLVPVGPKSDGYWMWDPDLSPSLFPYAGPGEGVRCHLLDQKIVLGQQINRVPLLGSGVKSLGVASVRPVVLLPHWKLIVEAHKGSSNASTLTVALEANGGRRETRP